MATLPLLPASESKLIGIARLAAEGESLRQGHEVEYFTLPVRSLLNRCTGVRMPFEWTINPYRGCEFACKYCYARYTHEFMEMRDGVDFEQKIYVKQHAANLLRQELRRVKPGEQIAIGTATDPYQPAERRFEVTRAILEELARHEGLDLGIITKGNLILRDLDLLTQIGQKNRLMVNLTITTLNVDLARILEPRAPRPDLRMETVRKLNQAGIRAGVSCAPVIPGITDSIAQSGSAGSRHRRSRRKTYLCQSSVLEALLRRGLPALSGKGISPACSRLPEALQRSRLPAQVLRQADIAADGASAARSTESAIATGKAAQSRPGADGIATEALLSACTAEIARPLRTPRAQHSVIPSGAERFARESLGAVERPCVVGSATDAAVFRTSGTMPFSSRRTRVSAPHIPSPGLDYNPCSTMSSSPSAPAGQPPARPGLTRNSTSSGSV